MGVPKFYRWITDRYPGILSESIHGPNTDAPSIVDNLYLDMNGIIHECSHGNNTLTGELIFEAILQNIFLEVKRIFDLVVPQQLLYIAVDGVAPRAKLNQQRARRFRSSRERLQALENAASTRVAAPAFDSNCITPGTEFMSKLSVALKYFIEHQMKTDARWANITIFFSGSEVPGEGEHKIVTYIREARTALDYCPNLRHCILGSDADMIMLALATHEPYFLVLRESAQFKFKPKHNNKNKSRADDTTTAATSTTTTTSTASTRTKRNKIMNYMYINILREYIINELLEGLNKFDFNTERILDDFVFLTFFVGNDFLPSLPALNINNNAFELIFDAYKTLLLTEPDSYLIENGNIQLDRLEVILNLIGVNEKTLFFDQYVKNEMKIKQKQAKLKQVETERNIISTPSPIETDEKEAFSTPTTNLSSTNLSEVSGLEYSDGIPPPGEMLDEDACRANYYREKLGIEVNSVQGQVQLGEVVRAYLLGLQWCLRYYSAGCCSWSWFYPYHYGPFLSDLIGLASHPALEEAMQLDSPLQPFQSLLACLPQASSVLLPECYAALMCSESSPLYQYYPTDFATDRNGKRQEYEAVVLLPFIDLAALLSAERELVGSAQLTTEEQSRNKFGVVYKYTKHYASASASAATSAATTLNIKEISPSFAPSAPFTAQLLPGTVPPATSLPGFLSYSQALARINSNKKYKHQMNSRRNCYSNDSSPVLDNSLLDVGNLSLSMQPRDTGNGKIGIAEISSSSGREGEELVLVLDEQTSLFLGALAQQVRLQSADFIPCSNTAITTAPAHTIQFSLSAHTAVASNGIPACWASLHSSAVLAKAGLLYGPVRGVIQPAALVNKDGAVSVKYVDLSHICLLEEFLVDRVCGVQLWEACVSLAQSAGSNATEMGRVNPVAASRLGLGFQRSIRIGTYIGKSAAEFVEWLTQELGRLQPHLPTFTAAVLEHSRPAGQYGARIGIGSVELVG